MKQAVSPQEALAALRIDRGAAPQKRPRRRWLKWGLAALAVAAVAAFVLRPKPAEVQVSTVVNTQPSQQYALLTASGYVVAQRRAAVASKATGRLVELRVREGSVVKQGDILARLDDADVQAALNQASAGVRQAEAAIGLSDANARQAQAGLRQAQTTLALAQSELTRTQSLVAQQFLSPQALEAAQSRAESAQAGVAAAEAALAQTQAGRAQAQSSVAVAQAAVRGQKVNEDFTLIRAPFDGVVLVKNANVGDIITPFSSAAGSQGAVVTMADMSTLEVEADVSEANVGKLKEGQPVEISLDAFGEQRWRGQVARIVPTVDRAKATVMTKVRFEQLDPRILPEMSAKVVFLTQAPKAEDMQAVLAANPKVLTERDGKAVVFRLEGEVVKAVAVTKGRTLGEVVELKGGLKPGDKLVLNPAPTLADGARAAVAGK
jgi:HlyD family secretion protein